jgi:hypothetical protein
VGSLKVNIELRNVSARLIDLQYCAPEGIRSLMFNNGLRNVSIEV